MNNLRKSGPIAVLAAAAAGLILATPNAAANTITNLMVLPDLSSVFPDPGVYKVSATVEEDPAHVILLDNGVQPRAGGPRPVVSGHTITWTWTPTTTGPHTLEARYTAKGANVSKTTTVQVASVSAKVSTS